MCALRLLASARRIGRIARGAQAMPHLGDDVFASAAIRSPIAVGILRPRVYVPSDLVGSLDGAQLAAVLAHERAHIHRRDLLGNFIQRALEAACDDWALRSAIEPSGGHRPLPASRSGAPA